MIATRLADCRASLALIRPVVDEFPVVILSMAWTSYENPAELLVAAKGTTLRLAGAGKQVILLGKVPEIPEYDRRCREKALRYPLLECPRWTSPVLPEIVAVNAELRAFASATPNVSYFDVTPYLCTDGTCSAFAADGRALYYDSSHLSMEASLAHGREIVAREGVPAAFQAIATAATRLP